MTLTAACENTPRLEFVICYLFFGILEFKLNIMNFYDFTVNTPQGTSLKMADYKDKAVLVVNTATKCGLTPQFKGLEALHQRYKDQGLVVLGFPCNQFMGQEPQSNESMVEYCQINHGVSFQLTEKIEVNGRNTHPIYKYLKKRLSGLIGKKIKWNFTKFLITPEGEPFKRYGPTTVPKKLEDDIKEVLGVK